MSIAEAATGKPTATARKPTINDLVLKTLVTLNDPLNSSRSLPEINRLSPTLWRCASAVVK